MKITSARFAMLVFLALKTNSALAQGYYSPIYGTLPAAFLTGSNLFANPLQANDNSLNGLFPRSITPQGTTVSLWNPAIASFDTNSVLTSTGWSLNLTLPPGTGALVIAPSPFTNSISGYVLDHDGSFFVSSNLVTPPLYPGTNGTYLLGDKTSLIDTGTDIFLNIIGREPYPSEKVTTLAGTSTYF